MPALSLSQLMCNLPHCPASHFPVIMPRGIVGFRHRLRSFSILHCPHRDTASILQHWLHRHGRQEWYRNTETALHLLPNILYAHAHTRPSTLYSLSPYGIFHAILGGSPGCKRSGNTSCFISLFSFDFMSYVPERAGNIIFRCKFNASRLRPIPVPYLLAQNHNTLS